MISMFLGSIENSSGSSFTEHKVALTHLLSKKYHIYTDWGRSCLFCSIPTTLMICLVFDEWTASDRGSEEIEETAQEAREPTEPVFQPQWHWNCPSAHGYSCW